ncbi:5-methylcytosine-specific restriction endonuclease system specificity protein McrC [Rheinheimera baltica]|uniref:5-methylcytosine-specific restriction endonuclease system specificity protein McrC n=1 Tax=Rheinheimera baltica TaxID=67576 RepID=A0ABT9I4I1_9GAMM|nr:5-methylcytosine-specific restriction endonuclease system specificity protein McrC [Rheinheimera baltica]MDP5138295.1 5-methylcytosine-specific restriction endonuclease system specificity protein McrC [Rheinheimera baltica]
MLASAKIECEGIPLQNLWLLMLYASDFRYQAYQLSGVEELDEHLADLVGDVLCNQVLRRLRRRLSYGYRHNKAELNRIRGRIDLLETNTKLLLLKGKVACRFEELSINIPRNQYIASALNKCLMLAKNQALKYTARKLLNEFSILGVQAMQHCVYHPADDQFSRHEAEDKKLIATAELMHQLALINESVGGKWLPAPYKQTYWVRRLFEKAVGGFYSVHLDKNWSVKQGKKLNWQIEQMTSNVASLLPGMEVDIFLENKDLSRRLIIDTKFTAITKENRFGSETLKSPYIYQIFAYLRSQEHCSDLLSLSSEGMLLHPSMGETFRETVVIQGHKLHFNTVDLSQPAKVIRSELLSLIQGQ